MISRVNTLAAHKQFAAAETLARDAVGRFPSSRNARLLLANVLLWAGKYTDARSHFGQLLQLDRRDVEARLGMAQSEYWSGDYRRAARDFREVLRLQPARREARQALAEIEAASRPGFRVDGGLLFDDQPYHAAGLTGTFYGFSDPLTKWQLDFAEAHRDSGGAEADTPLIRIGAETTVVPMTLRALIARMRFPDARWEWLPLVSVERRLAAGMLNLTVQRQDLLRTSAALRNHPTAQTVSLRLSSDSFAVHAEHLRYFDHNRGNSMDGYLLHPIARIAIGASAAYRDTAESRFANSVYDPYYTPQKLRELRLIVASTLKRGQMTIGLHLDGGVGREKVVGPFHPWNASANMAIPLFRGGVLSIAAERSATAFYTANEIHASVAGRF